MLEETGLSVGDLVLAAHVDSIHRDAEGRVQYHFTILDFAARWQSGDPVAGGDAPAATWVAFDAFDQYDLSAEGRRVVGLARELLGL